MKPSPGPSAIETVSGIAIAVMTAGAYPVVSSQGISARP
jgi:hypothetical protein